MRLIVSTIDKFSQSLLENLPDDKGHFGPYGGRFVSETLMASLHELE
ncbi:MAG: tryptophan synthase subunit beta, partial [Phototrophicales bacterium]